MSTELATDDRDGTQDAANAPELRKMRPSGSGADRIEPASKVAPAAVTVTGRDRSDGVLTVLIGSGARRNALRRADWRALRATLAGLAAEDGLRLLVVRGRDGAFCAGSDMTDWVGGDGSAVALADVDASFAEMEAALRALESVPAPTVAVLEGDAAGAGCQLALAADLRIAAASARIGMPVARLGIIVSPSFAGRMTMAVGPARAKELLYTGRLVGAPEAAALGLVTRTVPDSELDGALAELAATVAAAPPPAVRGAKAAVAAGQQAWLAAARLATVGRSADGPAFAAAITGFLRRRGGRPGPSID